MGVTPDGRALTCPVCGENTYVKKRGYIHGRACLCERNRQAVAAVEKLLPRCGAVMGDLGALAEFTAKCGDAAGHTGAHGQLLVTQVIKAAPVKEEPKDGGEVTPKGLRRSPSPVLSLPMLDRDIPLTAHRGAKVAIEGRKRRAKR